MPKKVLLLRSDVGLAGPARLMQGVARGLQEQGCTVTFATGGGEVAPEIQAEGFEHHDVYGLQIKDRGPLSFCRAVLRVHKIASEVNPDIVHSFNVHAGMVGWLATLGMRRKVVNTVLGNGKERLLPWVPFDLIAVSESVKRKLMRFGVRQKNIHVVYNSTLLPHQILADRSTFEASWKSRAETEPFTFGSIAVFTGWKGHIEIAKSLLHFKNKYPDMDAKILYVGTGPAQIEVKNFYQKHNLTKNVEFVGSTANVFQYLERCHGFIHLAKQETFGLVLAEAGGQGLPSIASNVGGIPEVVLDGVSGILVSRDDLDAVSDAMAKLVGNRDLAIEMGWKAAERARDEFMAEQIGENLMATYAKL